VRWRGLKAGDARELRESRFLLRVRHQPVLHAVHAGVKVRTVVEVHAALLLIAVAPQVHDHLGATRETTIGPWSSSTWASAMSMPEEIPALVITHRLGRRAGLDPIARGYSARKRRSPSSAWCSAAVQQARARQGEAPLAHRGDSVRRGMRLPQPAGRDVLEAVERIWEIPERAQVVSRRAGGGNSDQEQRSVYLDHRTHLHPGVHRVQDWLVAHPEKKPALASSRASPA